MTDLDRIEATRAALDAACREAGAWVSGDGRVGEETAAELLGIAPGTLANRRANGSAPRHYRLGGGGHRITYAVLDLAVWIESAASD